MEKTDHYKFLGIYIDSKLDWTCHANYVLNKLKLKQSCHIFNSIKHVLPLNAKKLLYHVVPHCVYGVLVWALMIKTTVSKAFEKEIKNYYPL